MNLIKRNIVEICIAFFMLLLVVIATYIDYTFTPISDNDIKRNYEKQKNIQEYKVMSVYQYMKVTKRNCFGAAVSEEIRYDFTYIGDDGNLYEFRDFENTECGLWKICLADQNKYVIKKDGIDTYMYLYLTEETLRECIH